MQRRWYDCWSSSTWAFLNFKVHIRQRKKDFGCFDIDSLQKITVGSKRDETSLSSDSGNVSDLKEWTTSGLFNRDSGSCLQWTNATCRESQVTFGRKEEQNNEIVYCKWYDWSVVWSCDLDHVKAKQENAFPHSEGTLTRWKDHSCFALLVMPIFVVFWHRSTPGCK